MDSRADRQPAFASMRSLFLGCILIRAGEPRLARASLDLRDLSLSLSLSLSLCIHNREGATDSRNVRFSLASTAWYRWLTLVCDSIRRLMFMGLDGI